MARAVPVNAQAQPRQHFLNYGLAIATLLIGAALGTMFSSRLVAGPRPGGHAAHNPRNKPTTPLVSGGAGSLSRASRDRSGQDSGPVASSSASQEGKALSCTDKVSGFVAEVAGLEVVPSGSLPRALFLGLRGIRDAHDDDTFDTLRTSCASGPGLKPAPRQSNDVPELSVGVCAASSTLVAPSCDRCLPGQQNINGGCKEYTPQVVALTKELRTLLRGDEFYVHLGSEMLSARQVITQSALARDRPRRILDVGFYWRPMYRFMHSFCPDEIVGLDPVADPVSAVLPCPPGTKTSAGRDVFVIHTLSMDMQEFQRSGGMEPAVKWGLAGSGRASPGPMTFDAVVCLGCDGSRISAAELEVFPRPFNLLISWPPNYTPCAKAYAKLSGSRDFSTEVHAVGLKDITDYYYRELHKYSYPAA